MASGQVLCSLSSVSFLQWGSAVFTHRVLGNYSFHPVNLAVLDVLITKSVVLGFQEMRHNQQKSSIFSQPELSKQIFARFLRNSIDLKATHFLNSFLYLSVPAITIEGLLLLLHIAMSFMCSISILQYLVSTSTCQALF